MNNVSAPILIGLTAWTLFLLILIETLRSRLIVTKAIAANEFKPDNSNLSPFMQRLAWTHANCVESLPIFSVLLIVALLTNRAGVTNPLALGCSPLAWSSPAPISHRLAYPPCGFGLSPSPSK